MYFDAKAPCDKSTRVRILVKMLKSPAPLASGVSTKILLVCPYKLCDRLKLWLQEQQAGKIPDLINEEIVAIVDKLLEDNCVSNKQHKQVLFKSNLLHTK